MTTARRPTVLARLERAFVALNQGVVIALMAWMSLLVFANVVTRYAFGFSINWAEEQARFAMIWVTFLAAGLAMREGRHVAIEFVQGLLPRRGAIALRAVVALVVLVFLAVLTWLGVEIAQFAWRQRTPVLGWPQGAMYLAIPIGSVLFAIHFLIVLRGWLVQRPNAIDAEVAAAEAALRVAERAADPAADADTEDAGDPSGGPAR